MAGELWAEVSKGYNQPGSLACYRRAEPLNPETCLGRCWGKCRAEVGARGSAPENAPEGAPEGAGEGARESAHPSPLSPLKTHTPQIRGVKISPPEFRKWAPRITLKQVIFEDSPCKFGGWICTSQIRGVWVLRVHEGLSRKGEGRALSRAHSSKLQSGFLVRWWMFAA